MLLENHSVLRTDVVRRQISEYISSTNVHNCYLLHFQLFELNTALGTITITVPSLEWIFTVLSCLFKFCPAHQDNFIYLNQGECPYVYEVDDGENFEEMREAMDLVGIMEDEQLMIFRILAGILHIGNVYIHASEDEGSRIDVSN